MSMDFLKIETEHFERYPKMMSQDFFKLAYQSEFGPRHMLDNSDRAISYIDKEWSELSGIVERLPEPIGNGLCRFHMNEYSKAASDLLGELFYLTAKEHNGSLSGLYERLDCLKNVSSLEIDEYKSKGCPIVHHSKAYNEAYNPHYRLLKWEYACYFDILLRIKKLRRPAVIAIDGRCGSGKTNLASLIMTLFDCNVFHIDDYYLPMSQRKENWEHIPAGNIDIERFENDVLAPVKVGETVLYRPYNCSKGDYDEEIVLKPKELTIIEGSYSHHPKLSNDYDFKIFLTSNKDIQAERLLEREGGYYKMFVHRWIPMEESYLSSFEIQNNSDVVIDTSNIF